MTLILHLGGIFMSKNLVYPLKDGYDAWKMLSYECINWGQFATVIDKRWFDELLKKWESWSVMSPSKWVGNDAIMTMIPGNCYHMNASVEGNLQQSLRTNDLMNSFREWE